MLSVEANDQAMLEKNGETSIRAAVHAGDEGVVRVLVANKSNFGAVGGRLVLAPALSIATMEDQARILHVLLNVEGEDRQRFWARASTRYAGDGINLSAFELELACLEGISSFHMSASYGTVRSGPLATGSRGGRHVAGPGRASCKPSHWKNYVTRRPGPKQGMRGHRPIAEAGSRVSCSIVDMAGEGGGWGG